MSYESAPATKMIAVSCACCARPLLDAESVEAGMGPVCRRTHGYRRADAAPDWGAFLRLSEGAFSLREVLGALADAPDAERVFAVSAAWMLVDTRRVANIVVHRIACRQTGPEALALAEALGALGFRKLSERVLSRLVLARGKTVFRDGAGGPPCSSCGCEVLNGRRNGEHTGETSARTGGRRAEIVDRQIACAGCGRVHDVVDAGPITPDEAELLGVAS